MAEAEERKIIAEYIKYLSTLATGSLVLLITFLEKLADRPQWKIAMAVALIAFLMSIVGGVLVYTMTIVTVKTHGVGVEDDRAFESRHEYSDAIQTIGSIGLGLLWIGFLIGLIALTIFAIKNLLG